MIDSQTHKENRSVWFGDIPNNWKISKLKYVVNIYTGNSLNDIEKSNFSTDDIVEKNGYNYISSKDIDVNNNTCNYDTGLFIPASETRYKIAPRASTLLCIEGGSAGKKLTYTTEDVCFVNKLACFNSKFDINSKYVYFYLQSFEFKNQFQGALSGLIGGVSLTNLNDFEILVPPLPEQTHIADFLDRKTAQIDEIIAKKEKMLTLLDEKKKAVINEAVTKGLNPNAKMKDSGIEWIGEIPENWEVILLSRLVDIVRGASPRPAGDPRFFDGNYMPWITVGEVTNAIGKFITETSTFLTKEGSENSRIIFEDTLLLSNSGATLGVPKISKIKGCINDGSVAFLNLKSKLDKNFLYYFLESHTDIYRGEASGYGQPNLNTDIVRNTPIPLPPLSEQNEISDYIEKKLDKVSFLNNKISQQVEKLKEYRQSLISEAVTGKIDVKNYN